MRDNIVLDIENLYDFPKRIAKLDDKELLYEHKQLKQINEFLDPENTYTQDIVNWLFECVIQEMANRFEGNVEDVTN